FVDAFTTRGEQDNSFLQATDNGIHLNELGYGALATRVSDVLGWSSYWAKNFKVDNYEALRQTIIAKNQLFFNRWRPENSTYLFLFRKHEQGKNAREIPQFDPLITAEEEKIAKLRREPPKTTSPVEFAHKPKQVPITEHPAT